MGRMRSLSPAAVITTAVLVMGAGAGALLGERTLDVEEEIATSRAARIVSHLLEWLPEETEPSTVVYEGISGMLEKLDPHSNFLEPGLFQKMRALQEGSFFGVGIIISRRAGKITVIAPVEGTPAARKGLKAGDVISAVEGVPTEDRSLDDVVDGVRGPEGTDVHLTIERPGLSEPLEITITRARIPTNSVRYAFMIRPGIGYIRLSEFSNTSAREVGEALERLVPEGMESLIFDLRNNPGGPLDAAVGVSDPFLQEGQLIVSTKGRTPDSILTFNAPNTHVRFDGPVVVLVNTGSASAAEIIAGALQDHDRALVVGEVTWGKGLVQTVFTVRDAGLALTTARYYTPSGRCIQRDYDSFIDYITHRNGNGPADNVAPSEIYTTEGGRTVLGGGGITPDVTIEAEELDEAVVLLYTQSAFFRFGIDSLRDVPEAEAAAWAADFEADDDVLDRFWAFVLENELLDQDEVVDARESPDVVDSVGRALKVEMLNSANSLEAGYREAIEGDNQAIAAIELIPDAAALWAETRERMGTE